MIDVSSVSVMSDDELVRLAENCEKMIQSHWSSEAGRYARNRYEIHDGYVYTIRAVKNELASRGR